jgi:hypothetical protein
MTSPGGEWVRVPIPGQPDRWDFVPAEQPPSPDDGPGTWHVVGGSGGEVGTWEWFPSAAAPPPSPPPVPAPSAPLTWDLDTPLPAPPPPVGAVAASWQTPPPVLMAPAPKRSKKLPLVILGVVVALAAIGSVVAVALSGGDDGKNKEEITALVNYVTTVDNGEDVCSSHLTQNFVSTVFGDLATCENDDDDEPDDAADATGATVTQIEIDDDTATALVSVIGGDTDGATGTWAFVKSEDDVWRVSEWRADYLRSTFEKTFGEKYVSEGEDDPFADEDVRNCVKDTMLDQDDSAFLNTAYQLFRNSDESVRMLLGFMSECPTDIEGVSALRALFEKGFRAKADLPSEITDCIVLGMRSQLTDEEIKELSLNRGAPAPADVQSRIQEITLDCAGAPTSFDPTPGEFDAPAPDLGT